MSAARATVAAGVSNLPAARRHLGGPVFNNPRRKKGWFRIEREVIDTIKHTCKGSTIRIAVHSFDRMPVADDDYDLNEDGEDGLILSVDSDQEYVAIQGTYNGDPDTHMVVTVEPGLLPAGAELGERLRLTPVR